MAPVTATSTGVARQTIDDLNLIALIERLSKFDTAAAAGADDAAGSAVVAAVTAEAEATQINVNDGDVSMADVDVVAVKDDDDDDDMMATTASAPAAGEEESGNNNNKPPPPPPLDIPGLVAELDSVPKWRFQELVRQYILLVWCHIVCPLILFKSTPAMIAIEPWSYYPLIFAFPPPACYTLYILLTDQSFPFIVSFPPIPLSLLCVSFYYIIIICVYRRTSMNGSVH